MCSSRHLVAHVLVLGVVHIARLRVDFPAQPALNLRLAIKAGDPTAGHTKMDGFDGGGRGKISSVDQVEFLLEYCASRRRKTAIEMLVDLLAAAQGKVRESNGWESKPLARRTRTSVVTEKKRKKDVEKVERVRRKSRTWN